MTKRRCSTMRCVVRKFCEDAGLRPFDRARYSQLVPDLVNCLRSGLPPVASPPSSTSKWSPLPSVFNAAWEHWLGNGSLFEDFEKISDDARGAALRSLSNLAFKGIQAAEHERLWRKESTKEDEHAPAKDSPTSGELGPSVLTESTIRDELKSGNLVITPLLEDRQIGEASVNLRLGTHFVITRAADLASFKPDTFGEGEIRQCQQQVTKMLGEKFVLHPRRLVLAATLEYIAMPKGIAGLVLSRSSFGRLGLMVATATFVHPGWKGCLTLELSNAAEIPIELPCGSPIAQLVLVRSDEIATARREFPIDRQPYPTFPEFSPLSSAPDWRKLNNILKHMEQL